MLKLENISKSFVQRGTVLDGLIFEINEGDSVSITGPSGSGKTTLLNIIGAMDLPDAGNIIFKGRSILKMTPDESALYRNKNIGFIFQEHLLLPHLTVKENILLPLYAHKISKEEFNSGGQHAKLLMERTGIASLDSKYPFQISGGEAQRVTLVRALVNKPDILLADEPTGSLDGKNADHLGTLLSEMNREFGITLIVATHSSDLAAKMNQHYRLENGKLKN
ncbi:MAG: ABC transporter ATP-binding protein [Bacteroidia bacterium]|nr:ABC transporter ATP-binding protein [Bacteroidia bacterium]